MWYTIVPNPLVAWTGITNVIRGRDRVILVYFHDVGHVYAIWDPVYEMSPRLVLDHGHWEKDLSIEKAETLAKKLFP
jgi:hypothetical protein